MKNNKAFTLMEILIVVLIIAVIVGVYNVSHRNGQVVRQNERARGMFIEFANAARLYDEMYPGTKLYGTFGDVPTAQECAGCNNPCMLFPESHNYVGGEEVRDSIASFALQLRDWGIASCNAGLTYEGYRFVLCNPSLSEDALQPAAAEVNNVNLCNDAENDGQPKFAVMITPNNVTLPKYANRYAWITGGQGFGSTYN